LTAPAPFLARQLGDFVLIAQLSEDALGTVYRALNAADERRFVRLRVLQTDELSAPAVERAIRENRPMPALVHDAIVSRPQLDVCEDIPFVAWDETSGWTLDMLLGRVRALGIRVPAEYALLIVERIAAALEHAFRGGSDGRPTPHGLLWPGFVSISADAIVRVGGFGVADAVLPSLHAPKLSAEIGPYTAPEVRSVGIVGENSDVYSLGAILMELLTGRRPQLDEPNPELRAGDPRSEELEGFLRKCLASPDVRFASAVDAHRALQQIVTGNPFSLYTANLSLFLYKLLNPESLTAVPGADHDSTNPVVVTGAAAAAVEAAEAAPSDPGTPRRRSGDQPADDSEAQAFALAELVTDDRGEADREEDAIAVPTAEEEARRRAWPPLPLLSREWARPAAALAAAATVAIAAFLIASQIHSIRRATTLNPGTASGQLAVEAVATTTLHAGSEPVVVPAPVAPAVVLPAHAAGPSASTYTAASASKPPRPVVKVRKELRKPTEELRLRAALARIEADRLNARETVPAIFVQGKSSEEEGERLMRERDYQAAQLAFSRAARLFQQARELTWEERVRQTDLASAK
jgi:hypothetical protein